MTDNEKLIKEAAIAIQGLIWKKPFGHMITNEEAARAAFAVFEKAQGEPSGALHADHVTVALAYDGNCLEGECDHVDENGEPEDLSACPTVPPFEVCVDCMDEDGRGRDPEHWDDVPLISWPCVALRAAWAER